MNLKEEIIKLKKELDVTLVAHFYQRDEVFDLADITGDSLELAKKVMLTDSKYVVFCGVGFMGESVKVMSPEKTVLMPKIACCAMARMIDVGYFEENLKKLNEADIICYNGFCSVHQQFSVEDIEFYRQKFPDILIAVHPECDPSVCDAADFVGSTSQLITYIKELPEDQKIAVGTEFNMVSRLRSKNTYILSSTKPECPTMNETTLQDVYNTLKSIKDGKISKETEITVSQETAIWAKVALERMFEV